MRSDAITSGAEKPVTANNETQTEWNYDRILHLYLREQSAVETRHEEAACRRPRSTCFQPASPVDGTATRAAHPFTWHGKQENA